MGGCCQKNQAAGHKLPRILAGPVVATVTRKAGAFPFAERPAGP
jgi:hypothetical protein